VNTALQYHADFREHQFDNMMIDAIKRIEDSDSQSMAKCHLKSYGYTDDRSLENISEVLLRFNSRVRILKDHLYEAVHSYVGTQLLRIHPYDQTNWSKTNYYHYSNIVHYFWIKSWEQRENKSDIYLDWTQIGSEHSLTIKPSGDPIAKLEYKEDAEKLYNFLLKQTDGITNWLNILETDRIELISRYNTFTTNIARILREYKWTDTIKGRCNWERQFWRIRGSNR
jgi:hypothetical protein